MKVMNDIVVGKVKKVRGEEPARFIASWICRPSSLSKAGFQLRSAQNPSVGEIRSDAVGGFNQLSQFLLATVGYKFNVRLNRDIFCLAEFIPIRNFQA
jgi:hypothetical protein